MSKIVLAIVWQKKHCDNFFFLRVIPKHLCCFNGGVHQLFQVLDNKSMYFFIFIQGPLGRWE